MHASSTTGFHVIDTYNILKDMQTSDADYEEEFDTLTEQAIPQFSFSSPSSHPPSLPTPPNPLQHRQPSPSPSPHALSPAPQPITPTHPHDLYEQQNLQSLIDMELEGGDASFFQDLMMGQPTPTPVLPSHLSPSPTPTPTTTVLTNFVAEAASSGCTLVEITNPEAKDQQLLDVIDLYDLDKQHYSFYEDNSMEAIKLQNSCADWMLLEELPMDRGAEELLLQQNQQQAGGTSLTELGPMVAGSVEQNDLLHAFDSLRRDILQDCKLLSISPDPRTWSTEDTRSWVSLAVSRCQNSASTTTTTTSSSGGPCPPALAMPGSALCSKRQEEFVNALPQCGGTMFDQLQLWKALADLPALPSKPQQNHHHDHQHQLHQSSPQTNATTPTTLSLSPLPPSVSPAPSLADSMCSSQSSSLSSSPLSSSSSSLSEADLMLWAQGSSSVEDLFHHDSAHVANLTPATKQPTTTTTTKKPTTPKRHHPAGGAGRPGKQIRLWEFLKELLEDQDQSIKWLDRARGIFKIEDSNRVARLWGLRKNHPAMNYDKLSRSVRQYYKKGIIKKTTQSRRLVYQFCERYL